VVAWAHQSVVKLDRYEMMKLRAVPNALTHITIKKKYQSPEKKSGSQTQLFLSFFFLMPHTGKPGVCLSRVSQISA